MNIFLSILLLSVAVHSKAVFKRNSYGDEAVTPAVVEASSSEAPVQEVVPDAVPVASETVAPSDQAPSEKSGYRKKRDAQNSYGDEQVTEAALVKQGYAQEAVPEALAEQITVETSPAPAAPVEQSGYRKRREAQNSYGDEPVSQAPVETTSAPETNAPVQEQAPEVVPAETPTPVDQALPSEKSGYRKRREAQNSYGDESVTEAPKQEYSQETPENATPVAEVVPEQVPSETPALESPVEQSGY